MHLQQALETQDFENLRHSSLHGCEMVLRDLANLAGMDQAHLQQVLEFQDLQNMHLILGGQNGAPMVNLELLGAKLKYLIDIDTSFALIHGTSSFANWTVQWESTKTLKTIIQG